MAQYAKWFEGGAPSVARISSSRPFPETPLDAAATDLLGKEANHQSHLSAAGRVNLGSFYTPAKYVTLVGEWLLSHGVDEAWTIADLSSGYGAFFELQATAGLRECRYIGNDIDAKAVEMGKAFFPKVEWTQKNALAAVSRRQFGLAEREKVAVVGNPPYNDVTSQANQRLKIAPLPMDSDIRTRDLGMSSLLAYAKLRADLVAVLHPLSYLIKKSNFTATASFFGNYRLLEHIVFSSQEFAGTSKTSAFPVIVALYERADGAGLSYAEIREKVFRTVEGANFSLAGFDYITDEVAKYPGGERYTPEILFYTLRDVNALKRSRTFIKERIANAVDVEPAKLAYYCYIDCFKRYADLPYWLGNFNVPFRRAEFPDIAAIVTADARHHHPDIFGESPEPSAESVEKIRNYIAQTIKKQ